MTSIQEKLKRVPTSPGVYLMKNSRGQILYVGKAKSLRSRLSSYFMRAEIEDAKTRVLVREIADFEIILVSNEVEALLLERTLIKEHKPDFNIILRDDKEYPYLKIDMQNLWPRIKKVRTRKDDGSVYLGPYSHVSQLYSILELTYRIFPLIRCNEYTFKTVKRPCNYYGMKKCLGPCTLPVDNTQYKDMMRNAIAFLQGKDKSVLKKLQEQMKNAAEEERYEAAAGYRDQILALKVITQTQNVVIKSLRDCDAIAFYQDQDHIAFHVLNVRDGKINGRESFLAPMRLSDASEALSAFLLQFYEYNYVPPEIYIPLEMTKDALEELLSKASERNIRILCPQRGQKKSLVDLSANNARYHLEETLTKQTLDKSKLAVVQKKLQLSKLPIRMDCFDISNIQGTAIVASHVCFIDGKPAKKHYRLYNIEDARENPDDYWALRQVMQRYFRGLRNGVEDVPDLLLIDGGKGQLSSVLSVAKEFPDLAITIRSIAKNRVSHISDERILRSEERIFAPGEEDGLVLPEGSVEFQLLTQLRDEAHRFAITHHRKRRKKIGELSFLDDIKGIGPVAKKRLLQHLGNIEALQAMSVEELMTLAKVSKKIAEQVLAALHNFKQSDLEDER